MSGIKFELLTIVGKYLRKAKQCLIGQLHDNVILLQLPESFSVLFSYAN